MQYKSVKGYSGWGQLAMLLIFLGVGFILAAVAQVVIAMQMLPPGTPLFSSPDVIMKAMLAPENVGLARLLQVLSTLLLLFVPAVLYSLVTNGKNPFWLGFNKYINIYQVGLAFCIIFIAGVAAGPLEDITKSIVIHFPKVDTYAKNLEDLYNEQALALSNLKSWPEFLMAILIMAFFPAMFEEVFFRGTMQNLLVRWWKKPFAAILFTSIVFSLIHMSIYLFLSRAVLGFVLGLLFYKSKNIWVNIFAHFLNNFIALALIFYTIKKTGKVSMHDVDPSFSWWVSIVALVILIFLFQFFNKVSILNRTRIDAKENLLIAEQDPFRSFANLDEA
jgi:membrane protease YdiL (CAAX protease family)